MDFAPSKSAMRFGIKTSIQKVCDCAVDNFAQTHVILTTFISTECLTQWITAVSLTYDTRPDLKKWRQTKFCAVEIWHQEEFKLSRWFHGNSFAKKYANLKTFISTESLIYDGQFDVWYKDWSKEMETKPILRRKSWHQIMWRAKEFAAKSTSQKKHHHFSKRHRLLRLLEANALIPG